MFNALWINEITNEKKKMKPFCSKTNAVKIQSLISGYESAFLIGAKSKKAIHSLIKN